MSFLSSRRARKATASDGQAPVEADEGTLKSYPCLLKFLGSEVYDDGASRVPGSLSIFVDGGVLKACANDKDGEFSAYVSGTSLKGLLDTLEKKLAADTLDWRPWKKPLTRKK